MRKTALVSASAAALLFISALPAAAQTGDYIGVSAFADVRQFGSTNNVYYYGTSDDFTLDSTAAGGGLRVGTFLHPRVSLELSIDAGTKSEVDVPDSFLILATFPVGQARELKASTQFYSVSTVVGFHPPSSGRVRLGYLAGFSFVRGTYKSAYPSYIVPVELFRTVGLPELAVPTSLPPPNSYIATVTQRDLTGGLLLGVEAAVDVTKKLAVVPEFRMTTFSLPGNGAGVFLLRPGVSARWKF